MKGIIKFFKDIFFLDKMEVEFDIDYSPVVKIKDNLDFIIVLPHSQIIGDKTRAYAYLSVGEINPSDKFFPQLEKEDFLGKNDYWKTYIVDIASSRLQKVMEEKVNEIFNLGFQRIFIDTIDSLEAFITPAKQKILCYLIKKISDKCRGKVIINRGMWLYEWLKNDIEMVLLESFFYSRIENNWFLNNEKEMNYLLSWVRKFHQDGKIVLAVDYSPAAFQQQRELKRKAREWGVNWIVKEEHLGNVQASAGLR